ncbi:MAG: hypothetical protein U0325_05415 [Polyangiales bacterium]
MEATATAKVNEKLTSTPGEHRGPLQLEVTAQQEMEFAETLKLIAEDLSIERCGRRAHRLGGELFRGHSRRGGRRGAACSPPSPARATRATSALRHLFQGDGTAAGAPRLRVRRARQA